jgi:HSP20 family protein
MATTDTQTRQSRQDTKEQTGGTPERAGGMQERGLSRRGGYDPLALPLFSGDLLPSPFSLMNPFALLRRMTGDMDRAGGGRAEQGLTAWVPTIEIDISDDQCIVRAELPGLKPEEVRVEAVDGALVIEGERRVENEDVRSHRTERMYGRFYRMIQLPDGADLEHAQARFQDGVLEITVPVREQQSDRRQIPIDTGASGSAQGSQTGQTGQASQAGQAGQAGQASQAGAKKA